MVIAIITCTAHPHLTECDLLFTKCLQNRGHEIVPLIWDQTNSNELTKYDAVVIRSPWDYIKKLDQFEKWLKMLPNEKVYNSKRILLWNLDKVYLKDIENEKIRIVPTKWISATEDLKQIEKEILASSWNEMVIKPSKNAGGHFTYRFKKENLPDLTLLKNRTLMCQPFLTEIINRGEVSLLYAGNIFSHAIIKTPKSGEFRIQVDYGGEEHSYDPTKEELDFGQKILRFLEKKFNLDEILYVRIDITNYNSQPHLIELEILEPSLFLNHSPEKADLFASELLKRLH